MIAFLELVAFVCADEDGAPARRIVGRFRLLSSLHARCWFRPSIQPQRHARGKYGKNVASVPMFPVSNFAIIGNWTWLLATLETGNNQLLHFHGFPARLFGAMGKPAKKPLVYLETSFISYLTAPASSNEMVARRQVATHKWWEEEAAKCDLMVSYARND